MFRYLKFLLPLMILIGCSDADTVSEEDAKTALEECNGEPAEAIIKLMGG